MIDLGGDGLRVGEQHELDPQRMQLFRESVFCGAHSRWYLVEPGQRTARLGVYFKPGGAFPFFGPAAGELHGRHVPLGALWGRSAADELCERLHAQQSAEARFQTLERFLVARFTHNTQSTPQRFTPHPAVAFALDALCVSPQPQTIAQVVEQSGLCHARFIKVFHREVGMSPKRFSRLRRFLDVARQTGGRDQTDRVDWVELALVHGYYDQAHLVKDFREFAGVSPATYLPLRDARSRARLSFPPAEDHSL
jgi:AraC-like DNA-binding protein